MYRRPRLRCTTPQCRHDHRSTRRQKSVSLKLHTETHLPRIKSHTLPRGQLPPPPTHTHTHAHALHHHHHRRRRHRRRRRICRHSPQAQSQPFLKRSQALTLISRTDGGLSCRWMMSLLPSTTSSRRWARPTTRTSSTPAITDTRSENSTSTGCPPPPPPTHPHTHTHTDSLITSRHTSFITAALCTSPFLTNECLLPLLLATLRSLSLPRHKLTI
jgi:hypothetical protein